MNKPRIERNHKGTSNTVAVLAIIIAAVIGLFIWLSPSNTIDPPIEPASSLTNQYDVVTPNWSEVRDVFEDYDKEITSLIPDFTSTTDTTYSVKNTSTEGEDGWSITTKLDNTQEDDIKNYEDELINNDFEQTQDHEYLTPVLDKPYDLYVVLQTEQEIPYVVTITYICIPKDTITSWPFSTLVRNFGYSKARAIPMVTNASLYEVTSESKEEVIIELSTDKPSTIYYKYVDDLTAISYTLNNQTYVKSTSGLSFDLAHNIGVTIDIKSVPTWVEVPSVPEDPTDTDEEPTIPDGPTNPDTPTTPDEPTVPDTPATPDRVTWATVIGTLDKYAERSLPSIVPEYIGNVDTTTFSSRTITDSNFISAYKYGIVATNTTEGESNTYIDTLITRGYTLEEEDTISYKIVTSDGYYTIHIEVRFDTNQTNINIYGTQNPRVAWSDTMITAIKDTSGLEDIDSIIEPYMSINGEYSVRNAFHIDDDWYVTIEISDTAKAELEDWLDSLSSFAVDEFDGYKLSNVSKYRNEDIFIRAIYDDRSNSATIHFDGLRTRFYWDDIILEVEKKMPSLDISKVPHLEDTSIEEIKLYNYNLSGGIDANNMEYQRISITGLSQNDINRYNTILETNGYELYDGYWINEDDIAIRLTLGEDDNPSEIIIGIVSINPRGIEGTYFYAKEDGVKKVIYGSNSFTVYTYNVSDSTTSQDYISNYSITDGKVNGPDDTQLKILPNGNLGNKLFKTKSNPTIEEDKFIVYPLIDGNLGVGFNTSTVTEIPSRFTYGRVSTIMPNALKGKTLTIKTIPSSITTIGASAFEDVELSNLIIRRSIKYIGVNAFKNSNLNSLEFEDISKVKYIDDEAFSYNEIADEPDLSPIPFVGKDIYSQFGNIEGTFYRYERQTGQGFLHRYIFDKATKTFTWDQKMINKKGEWEGSWKPSMYVPTSYTTGKQIKLKTFYYSAFEDVANVVNNDNLSDDYFKTTEEPIIEDGILYMDTYARGVGIAFTKSIKDNKIPSEFNGKKVEMILRSGVTPESAYATITIPKSIKFLGMYALDSTTIRGIVFEEGSELEEFAPRALYSTGISNIVIPNTVKKIGKQALAGLGTVTFAPNSIIETLEPEVFGNEIYDITFPKSLKSFEGALQLRSVNSINIEEGSPYLKVENDMVMSVDGKEVWFGNPKAAKDITISEGVEIIHKYAFYNNHKKTISLPSTLKVIESGAFYANNFTNLLIPASVEYIADYAFFVSAGEGTITSLTFESQDNLKFVGLMAFGNSIHQPDISWVLVNDGAYIS